MSFVFLNWKQRQNLPLKKSLNITFQCSKQIIFKTKNPHRSAFNHKHVKNVTGHKSAQPPTLIRELGFSIMYLMEPWMFSVHDTSQVTLLSWRTSFHLVPGGGCGTLESLCGAHWILHHLKKKKKRKVHEHLERIKKLDYCTHLLQLMIMSSGLMRRLSMPILGWSPRPRNRPGGSMRKLAIRSLWLSMIQKPYSCKRRSFASFIFYEEWGWNK